MVIQKKGSLKKTLTLLALFVVLIIVLLKVAVFKDFSFMPSYEKTIYAPDTYIASLYRQNKIIFKKNIFEDERYKRLKIYQNLNIKQDECNKLNPFNP
jgi:hypothetical protein